VAVSNGAPEEGRPRDSRSRCVRRQDDDKRILGDETGLQPTQINNCARYVAHHAPHARTKMGGTRDDTD
jgi:hypothetical protein